MQAPWKEYMWPGIYALLFCIVVAGAANVYGFPVYKGKSNVDWTFIGIAFVTCAIFPLFSVLQSLRYSSGPLPRASWKRGLKGFWWTDPLQLVRISIISLAGAALGRSLILTQETSQGIMMFWWYVFMALGLIVGERVTYVVFRKRIA